MFLLILTVIYCILFQLHGKFELMKKQNADEKKGLDDKKARLEQEMNNFQKMKAQAIANAQAQSATIGIKKK